MNEPSDPQRSTGGDRPRDTAAFEDTEFSFGDAATRGYTADVVGNAGTGGTGGDDVIDADVVGGDVTGAEALGSTSDPEMTGIIPAVHDDSPRPATLPPPATAAAGTVAPATPSETPPPTTATSPTSVGDEERDGDGADDTGDDRRRGLAAVPPWAWVLGAGAVLAALVGLVSVGLMRGNDVTDSSPLTSVVPSYDRPSAWDSRTATSVAAVPPVQQGYGFDPYSDGLGSGAGTGSYGTDSGTGTGGGATDTTDGSATDTGESGPGGGGHDSGDPEDTGTPGNTTSPGDTGGPGTGTGDTDGGAGDTDNPGGETTE
ncbi:hypothetical protein [uncultured Corynebacterium sp.]|uniref:hypothetical protein n=1 Tax=uncultured Corynebacterium sp. TaxID=159447 RepID=UPI0025E03468|nr:hypothetical protein [uncultured Corynebacterium sp.]